MLHSVSFAWQIATAPLTTIWATTVPFPVQGLLYCTFILIQAEACFRIQVFMLHRSSLTRTIFSFPPFLQRHEWTAFTNCLFLWTRPFMLPKTHTGWLPLHIRIRTHVVIKTKNGNVIRVHQCHVAWVSQNAYTTVVILWRSSKETDLLIIPCFNRHCVNVNQAQLESSRMVSIPIYQMPVTRIGRND